MAVKHVEKQFAGRTLKIESGRLAKQAAGSCLVQFGETVVLAAVTVSDNLANLPYFPLTVEYREKAYAAGKIPGGFLKREGRPSDEEITSARVIDRSVRPLFPEGFKNEVQVFVYVLSADQENDADVLGVVAASTALSLSKVPWNGPIAAVRVGRVEGAWILNPTFQQLEFSDVDITVSGSRESIVMVEGIEYDTMRERVLTAGERVDGRDLDTVRPITCEVGWLPRTHGSALFTRGQTQALASVTLGTTDDEQRIDSIDVAQETTKSFMLHYNFPPFSTGEVKPVRGTSRREIGHGALAERALQAVLPPYEQFPYTIRIVSELLESNGSSSMATVVSGSLG